MKVCMFMVRIFVYADLGDGVGEQRVRNGTSSLYGRAS